MTENQTTRIQIQILQSHLKMQKIQTNSASARIATIAVHFITTSINASSKTLLNNQKNDNFKKKVKLNISKKNMRVSRVSIHQSMQFQIQM